MLFIEKKRKKKTTKVKISEFPEKQRNIWVADTLNHLFITSSYKTSKAIGDKNKFLVIGPLCTPHSICLTIGF